MCDSMHSAVISYGYGDSVTKIHNFGSTPCKFNSKPSFPASKTVMGCRDYLLTKLVKTPRKKDLTFMNQRYKACVFNSNEFNFSSEMSLKEENELGLEFSKDNEDDDDSLQVHKSLNGENDGSNVNKFEGFNFDEVLKRKAKAKDGFSNGEKLMQEEEGEVDEVTQVKLKKKGKLGSLSRRNQLMKRSNLLAKQVIGVHSALSLGFVSQLWVDTASWVVLEIEVRPSLLSSESGKVLLEDIERVGDVVLVQDETFVLNEFRAVGLETLVGYRVVTPEGRNLGKVRGYFFNINSGAVESLELDAFGNSLIPSSLVSIYALFTEDVLQVVSDTIIVHETAASRIQRLTKGFLSTINLKSSNFNREYDNLEEESIRPVKRRKSRRKPSKRKSYPGRRKFDDDLDLPMDYM